PLGAHGGSPVPDAADRLRDVAGEHDKPGAEAEAGVVRFDAETLEHAGLRIEPVRYRALRTRLELTGIVEPNPGGVVRVTPRATGRIISVLVNVGDRVAQGQRLATLASGELGAAPAGYSQASQRVATARANL